MKPRKLLVFAFWLAVAAALALVTTLPAAAQDPDWHHLKGTYFTTGDSSCFASSTGFNADLTPAAAATVYSQSASFQGTFKFNGDGTGEGRFAELYLTFPSVPLSAIFTGASAVTGSFPFTYTVDHRVLSFVHGLVTGTFTAGPLIGLPVSVTPPPMSGKISSNGTITLTSTVPEVETVDIVFPPPTGTIPIIRICYRAFVLVPKD